MTQKLDRGTDAQILTERKLTCEAIDGAIAFGYQNTNPPPSDDHWLAPYWKIGRKQAELESTSPITGFSEPDGGADVRGEAMLPQGFSVKRVEGHGWIVDPPSGTRWVAFEETPAGELLAALTADTAEQQQAYELGYQHAFASAQYTNAMGEAATAYFETFKHAHPLPAQFRWSGVYDAMMRAADAPSITGGSDVPEGYALVPINATDEMLDAGHGAGDFHIMHYDGTDKPGTPRYSLRKSWDAMLDVAIASQPAAPAEHWQASDNGLVSRIEPSTAAQGATLSETAIQSMVQTRGRLDGSLWKFDALGISLLINDIALAMHGAAPTPVADSGASEPVAWLHNAWVPGKHIEWASVSPDELPDDVIKWEGKPGFKHTVEPLTLAAAKPVSVDAGGMLTVEQREAINTALSLIGLSGDPRVRKVHKTLRALLTPPTESTGEPK
jgi:hypothetical protein